MSDKVEVEIVATDNASGKLSGLLGTLGKVATGVGAGLAAVGSAAVAGGAAIASLVMKTASVADGLVLMKDQTGLSTTRLQELSYAAGQTGVDMGSVTSAIGFMTRTLGSSPEAFDKLGIAVKNADGSMRSGTDVFEEALTKLEGISDPTERASAAFEIFGRGAQSMLPLVSQGSGALADMSTKANELGLVLDTASVSAAESFGDNLETLKASVTALGMNLATTLMPFLNDLINMLIAYMPMIRSMIEPIFPVITEAIKSLLPLVTQLIKGILPLAVSLITALMPIVTALMPIIIQIAGIIVQLVNALMPIINAILPLLTALLQVIVDILAKYIIPAIQKFAEWLGEKIPLAMAALAEFWETRLKPTIVAIKDFFDKVSDAIGRVARAVQNVIDWFKKLMESIGNLKLPSWLTPGSPTPLELGLIGIQKAMEKVDGSMPDFNVPVGIAAGSLPGVTGSGIKMAGGSGALAPVVINYQPMLSLSDETELRTKLTPLIIDGLKAAGLI